MATHFEASTNNAEPQEAGYGPVWRRCRITAIDMHVHLEPEEDNRIDAAAKKYFGDSGAARDRRGMAEYYRSRKLGFVVFSVDEKLTGKPRVTNDEVVELATANADIAIPFASIDPHRGSEGIAEA